MLPSKPSFLLFTLLIISILIPFYAPAQTFISDESKEVLKEFELYVAKTTAALGSCPVGIVVSRNAKIIFEKYSAGAKRKESFGPVNKQSLWPIFSATKSFVAGMLLSLATDGIIDLDDPVGKYLHEFTTHGNGPYDRRNVTIRHLASHTSGVSGPEEKQAHYGTPPDLNHVQIDTKPGAEFLYSGLGMHILERTIQAATGEDFAETLRKRILDPLGLKDTLYIYEYNPQLPMLPVRTNNISDPSGNYSLSPKAYRAHYGLYATARDVNRYGQLWLGNGTFEGRTYFTPELKKEAWKYHGTRASDKGRYGLLWWLFEEEGGYVMSGAGAKATAVVPEANVVITVLRIPLEPNSGPFNFYEDKKNLVLFAKKLGECNPTFKKMYEHLPYRDHSAIRTSSLRR